MIIYVYSLKLTKMLWSLLNLLLNVIFSAPEPKAQVHYCDHTLSVVNFHILDFSSETAEQNSTKLDRKQDLNVLYQVCVFWADRKNKMAAPSSDWLGHFLTSPLKPFMGIPRNLTGSKISMCSTKFVFFGPIGKTRCGNECGTLFSDARYVALWASCLGTQGKSL